MPDRRGFPGARLVALAALTAAGAGAARAQMPLPTAVPTGNLDPASEQPRIG